MSLADKMDFLEVIARYAYTYDGRDADGFAQLFTEEGIFEVIAAGDSHPELRLESRAAIHAWVVQRHHQVVSVARFFCVFSHFQYHRVPSVTHIQISSTHSP